MKYRKILLKGDLLAIKSGLLVFRAPKTFTFTGYWAFLPLFLES
jgi:hypothetical protein